MYHWGGSQSMERKLYIELRGERDIKEDFYVISLEIIKVMISLACDKFCTWYIYLEQSLKKAIQSHLLENTIIKQPTIRQEKENKETKNRA